MITIEEVLGREGLFNQAAQITHEMISRSSNTIYKVTADGTDYIVRIDGEQKDYVGLDRGLEVVAMKKAADLGISPKVHSSDDPRYIVMEYIGGGHIGEAQMREERYIAKMTAALKKVHQITGVDRDCSPFYMLERYIAGFESLCVPVPGEFYALLKRIPEIERRYAQNAAYTTKYSHNDYFNFNMIDQDDRIAVIDWELSGMSSVFFDLSTISFSAMYGEREDRMMLERYFGNYEPEYQVLLEDMKYMNMLRDAGWHYLHAGINSEHAEGYFPEAMIVVKNVERGHLHFRCRCEGM